MSKSSELQSKWNKIIGCGGCAKRRLAIKKAAKQFLRHKRRVAVMFSGGLDSTYVAWKLKQQGNKVDLYHLHWTYTGGTGTLDNSREFEAAAEIAKLLKLPLYDMGRIIVPSEHHGLIMRLPILGSLLICHKELTFDTLATGMAPGISDRDLGWHHVLEDMASHCMPTLSIIHPRDGILRSKIKGLMPRMLGDRVYSHEEKDDSQ